MNVGNDEMTTDLTDALTWRRCANSSLPFLAGQEKKTCRDGAANIDPYDSHDHTGGDNKLLSTWNHQLPAIEGKEIFTLAISLSTNGEPKNFFMVSSVDINNNIMTITGGNSEPNTK